MEINAQIAYYGLIRLIEALSVSCRTEIIFKNLYEIRKYRNGLG